MSSFTKAFKYAFYVCELVDIEVRSRDSFTLMILLATPTLKKSGRTSETLKRAG